MKSLKTKIKSALNSETVVSLIFVGVGFIIMLFLKGFEDTIETFTFLFAMAYVVFVLVEIYSLITEYRLTKRVEVNKEKLIIYTIAGIVIFILLRTFFEIKVIKLIVIFGVILFLGIVLEIGLNLLFFRIKNRYKLLMIDNITIFDFEIMVNKKIKSYQWNNFTSVKFDSTFEKVILKKQTIGKLVISKDYHNWYCFIKNVASQFNEFDRKYVRDFFAGLQTCQICGDIAVLESQCCSCGTDVWNEKLIEEFETKDNYIKKEQLELFATMDKDEDLADFYEKSDCFSFDETWKPVVNQDEVLRYSKETYWDL